MHALGFKFDFFDFYLMLCLLLFIYLFSKLNAHIKILVILCALRHKFCYYEMYFVTR